MQHSDFASRLEGLRAREENRVGGATYPLPLNSLAHAREEGRWSLARYSTVPIARFVLEPARASPNALALVVAATVLGVVLDLGRNR